MLIPMCVILALMPSATASAAAHTVDAPGMSPAVSVAGAPVSEDAPGHPWLWPVSEAREVLEPYRAPAHDYGPGHRGMDIAAQPGADVLAPAAGVVAFRGVVVDRPLLTIAHGDGYVTTLEPVVSGLAPGVAVTAGMTVGTVSAGGHAVRGSLHVGVRIDGAYVNPRGLFGTAERAVLLPCCEG
ncbi:hypothetical protein GCM10022383_24240 [Microbacterium soli]|uniref:M23ase beta-sheet core domain-containing protein n=1 Tax=Microbacterium soli TaxID=446075 RepID=A0ABP7NHS1_9MICO